MKTLNYSKMEKSDEMRILNYDEMKKLDKCIEVKEDELEEIAILAKEMIQKCVKNGGIGLAAPQVGINKKMFVFSFDNGVTFHIVINPFWAPKENKITKSLEQCLSLEEKETYYVERKKYILAQYYGISSDKTHLVKVNKNFRGEPAIIFQHEYDHLKEISIKDKGKKLNG